MATIDQLAQAIARQEGAIDASGNWIGAGRSGRNNNPGNLRDYRKQDGSWAIWPSLVHDDGGFPQFPTLSDGWAALKRDLGLKISRGDTLEALITAWAPPHENDTGSYIRNVANWTGIPTGVPLMNLPANSPESYVQPVAAAGSSWIPSWGTGDSPFWSGDLDTPVMESSTLTPLLIGGGVIIGLVLWLRNR